MNRFLRFCLFLLLSLISALSGWATVKDPVTGKQRPKVAVVLAGGGAKGMAHISALETIEQVGIPIDMVVGNSMGSLIGGLYSAGYTPAELRRLVCTQDWMGLLLDKPTYGKEGLEVRRENELYIIQMSLEASQWSVARASGILQGKNVVSLLREQMLGGLPDSIDFNSLPKAFSCVATEAQSGRVYEFHSGDIVQAMRASMAIPGAFTPVRKDSLIFVDGGVTNNFPVDVARRMGADVIIGLDLVTGTTNAQLMDNFADIITHLYDVQAAPLYEKNIRDCDLYIPLNVAGYGAASFTHDAIDTLLVRGEVSSRLYEDDLLQLKTQTLGLARDYRPAPTPAYPGLQYWNRTPINTPSTISNGLHRINDRFMKTIVCVGARFDNYEHASLLLAASMPINRKHQIITDLSFRLGNRFEIKAYVHHRLFNIRHMNLGYEFLRWDQNLYAGGYKAIQMRTFKNRIQLHAGTNWKNIDYKIGLRADFWHYSDILFNEKLTELVDVAETKRSERHITYFIEGEYNSLNSRYFPTRGLQFEFGGHLYTTNFYRYKNQNIVPEADVFYQQAFSVSSSFVLIPHIQSRFLFFDGITPLSLVNLTGGFERGMFADHQMTMCGIFYPEMSEDFTISAGFKVQQRLFKAHYLTGGVEALTSAPHLKNLFSSEYDTWGLQFGYTYRFMAGPMSAYGYWSHQTKEFDFLLNFGYVF